MGTDPAGGSFIGLQLGRKLASLPQSGSIDAARRVVDAARGSMVEHHLASGGAPSLATTPRAQPFTGDLAPAEASHVIGQVERVLDAEVLVQNRAAAEPLTTKGKPMSAPLVEIKGLGNAVAGFRSDLAEVRAIAADVSVSAGNLKAELADVKAQIEDARTQIKAEASSLGNSASGSAA